MIDYKKASDSELIDLLKSDDAAAFTEIYNRYGTFLLSFSYRKVGDWQIARDVVQDVFSYLWSRRSDIIIVKSFESFIFTAAKNRVLKHFKQERVLQQHLDNFRVHVDTIQDSTDYLVRHNDLLSLIEREIAALPEKMRIVFELSRKQNMNRKEIAEHLDVNEETVKTNMRRALKILKTKFGPLVIFFF